MSKGEKKNKEQRESQNQKGQRRRNRKDFLRTLKHAHNSKDYSRLKHANFANMQLKATEAFLKQYSSLQETFIVGCVKAVAKDIGDLAFDNHFSEHSMGLAILLKSILIIAQEIEVKVKCEKVKKPVEKTLSNPLP